MKIINNGDDFWFSLKWESFSEDHYSAEIRWGVAKYSLLISQELYLLSQASPEIYFSVILLAIQYNKDMISGILTVAH